MRIANGQAGNGVVENKLITLKNNLKKNKLIGTQNLEAHMKQMELQLMRRTICKRQRLK